MASGTITGTTSNNYITSKIVWSSTANIASNTSDVTVTFQLCKSSASTAPTYGTGSWTLNINGTAYTINKAITISNNNTFVTVYTKTVDGIKHQDDGSKSIDISVTGGISGTSYTSTNCSGTATLDTIARASVPTLSAYTFTIGSDVYLYTNRVSSSFKHNVYVRKKENEEKPWAHIITGLETSYNLNTSSIRDAFYNACPSATSTSMQLLLRTFNGSTTIGDKIIEFTIKTAENSTTKPKAVVSISPTHSLSGDFASLYIQGKTKVTANFSGSYANAHATLNTNSSSSSVYWNTPSGTTYRTITPYTQSISTDILTKSGSQSVSAKVRDSRGYYSDSVDFTIYVHPYENPSIAPLSNKKSVICERYVVTDTETGITTSYLKIQASRKYSTVIVSGMQKNFCALQYRVNNGSWKTLLAKNDTSSNTIDVLLENEIPDVKSTYNVQLRAYDDVGGEANAHKMTFKIPTEAVTYHLKSGGKGIAFGKYAEKDDFFECQWTGEFLKGILGTLLNQNVTDVLDFAANCTDGITPIITNDETNKESLPIGNYAYSVGIVHKGTADRCNVILFDYMSGKIAINVHLSGTWTGWKYITPQ